MEIGDFINFVVSSVGKAVSCIPVQKLPESVQDPETQAARIKHFASLLGKNAAKSAIHEFLKLLPGGHEDQKIKELEAEVRRLKMKTEERHGLL